MAAAAAAARVCDLCGGAAAVYCDADAAFLCWSCDAAVHGANFLVARHVRRVACAACRAADSGLSFYGPCPGPGAAAIRALCPSCGPAADPPTAATTTTTTTTTTSSASESSAASSSSRVPAGARATGVPFPIGIALDGALSCAAKLRGGTRERRLARARMGASSSSEEGWGESAA